MHVRQDTAARGPDDLPDFSQIISQKRLAGDDRLEQFVWSTPLRVQAIRGIGRVDQIASAGDERYTSRRDSAQIPDVLVFGGIAPNHVGLLTVATHNAGETLVACDSG